MQNIFKNLLLVLAFIPSLEASSAPEEKLRRADSLYNAGRFVQAFDTYDSLITYEGTASAAMLLKMAYIQEGLGQVDEALYYLNLYYLQTSDKRVLDKMEELAAKNDLVGYDSGDIDFLLSYYYQYQLQFTLLLAALTLFVFAILIVRKRQLNHRPMVSGIILIILLALLFYQVNMGADYGKGIIQSEETYVMSGPSAGAKVLDIITAGHRVDMNGTKDVWIEIEWDGREAYIKDRNIRPVRFL